MVGIATAHILANIWEAFGRNINLPKQPPIVALIAVGIALKIKPPQLLIKKHVVLSVSYASTFTHVQQLINVPIAEPTNEDIIGIAIKPIFERVEEK